MKKETKSQIPTELQALIRQFKDALAVEIETMKKNTTATRWELLNGRLVGKEGSLYLYEFTLDTLFNGIPDDSPVMLISDGQTAKGYIVSLVGAQVMIAVEESVGDFVNKATANIQPYWLLERLSEKLDELRQEDIQLQLKCINKAQSLPISQTQGSIQIPSELNEYQERAVHLALGNEVSYIWGPPGTGKTKTLAALLKVSSDIGDSSLIIAHTNVAVDQAVLASLQYLKGTDYYKTGRILRLGNAHLPQIRDDKNLNLDAIVENRSAPLQNRLADLHSRIQNNEKKLSRLQKTKKLITGLNELAVKAQELEKSLAAEQHRLKKLQEERSARKQSKIHAESLIERGQHMSWFARFMRGINLQELSKIIAQCENRLIEIAHEEKESKKRLQMLSSESQSLGEQLQKANAELQLANFDISSIESQMAQLKKEIRHSKQELDDLEKQIAALRSEVISNALIIATTVTGTYINEDLSNHSFARLICDEASMVPVPMIFYAGRFARKAITVAGDFCQLAPITIEKENHLVKVWLQRSIFEAAELDNADKIIQDPRAQMLKRQYRMQPQIRQLIGDVFYKRQLEDGRKEDNSKLC
jgi:predicted nuclease with TOPRIM domain